MRKIHEERRKYGPNELLCVRESGTRNEEVTTHLDYKVGQILDHVRIEDNNCIVIELENLIALL